MKFGKDLIEFKNNGSLYKNKIQAGSDKGLVAAALLVLAQSKSLTPVDTGKLHDEQFYVVEDGTATIGSPTEYAEAVEEMYPFLTPSFRANKANIEKLLGQALSEEVK